MRALIATVFGQVLAGARVIVPTFGCAGVLLMSRTPDLWAMTDADGHINSLPFITIACLILTLVMLLRWRQS